MPGTMFTEVVSPHAHSSGKWYTVPLSLLVHAAVFAVIVVIPLVATNDLPQPPQSMLQFIPVAAPPAPPPAARRTQPQAANTTANAHAAPLVAPPTIGVESGLVRHDAAIQTRPIDGLIEGFGGRGMPVEQAPPMVSASPEPIRAGGLIKPPARIRNVVPIYPHLARAAKVQGVVIIEAIIGVNGAVEHARVIRSIPLLDQAALDAVRAWAYTPTLLNGTPTPVIMTVTVQFTLN